MPSPQPAILTPSAHDGAIRLRGVPIPGEVPAIASTARDAWGLDPSSRLDLDYLCERLDIGVSIVSLGVPDGGAQGLLVPRSGGRFLIEVDPEPPGGWQSVPAGLRRSLARHRKRFLIAHELAHTLFYEDGTAGPQRVVFDSARQEVFCDELARALLVPREVAAKLPFSPKGVLEVQRRFDVSMELALRSSAAAHSDAGHAWLLLCRRGETLVQWTSAGRNLTTRALKGLRTLAEHATRAGTATARIGAADHHADALFLRSRNQVIVTPSHFAAG